MPTFEELKEHAERNPEKEKEEEKEEIIGIGEKFNAVLIFQAKQVTILDEIVKFLHESKNRIEKMEARAKRAGVEIKTLVSLKEWNDQQRKLHEKSFKYPVLNGIACPECGEELVDSEPYIITSFPPKRKVHCLACGCTSYRSE
jgi:hypothetical protein